jgi:hypothetical protein
MIIRIVQAALLALLLTATPVFAKKVQMVPAADQNPKPAEGKALVVFFRASAYGAAIASSVYSAPDDSTTFLGIVRYKDKVAVQMDPGQHRFMVIAENADFIDAELEAGKTYYVLISPRMGMWKARFSLFPIHDASTDEYNVQSPQFKQWMTKTAFVEIGPAAQAWYDENKASVEEKKADYLQKWNKMLPKDRAELVLHPQDGAVATP